MADQIGLVALATIFEQRADACEEFERVYRCEENRVRAQGMAMAFREAAQTVREQAAFADLRKAATGTLEAMTEQLAAFR
jgi:hypothetical protein